MNRAWNRRSRTSISWVRPGPLGGIWPLFCGGGCGGCGGGGVGAALGCDAAGGTSGGPPGAAAGLGSDMMCQVQYYWVSQNDAGYSQEHTVDT